MDGVVDIRILGIDHSTRTGWSMVENEICVETGNFYVENMQNESFQDFETKLKFVISKEKPDKIAIEMPRHQTNGDITRFLTGLYTIEKLVALNFGIQIAEVDPRTMKKFITGNGNATKKEVLDSLIDKFGVSKELIWKPIYYKVKNKKGTIRDFLFDESDATGLAMYVSKK